MNSIKNIILILFICFMANKAAAQKMYFNINGGYSFMSNSSTFRFNNDKVFDSNTQIAVGLSSNENVKLSLGKGLNFGGTIGYQFHKNIGAEIGINYLISDKTTGSSKYIDGSNYNTSLSTKMFQIKPTVVLSTDFEKINPYVKIGAIIGLGKIYMEGFGLDVTDTYYDKTEMNGGIAMGVTASFGLNYNIHKNFDIFSEASLNALNYTPKKGTLTAYTENGIDKLPTIPVRGKEYVYVDTTSYTSGGPIDDSKPRETMSTKYPFSSIGINIGIRYKL
ncbi:outer membrane beta-barrel protein [Flavobacterium sp.]|uniref:outer membrane beta-barrel protein n=1 Tax=Flavobacterium sp. TaxID=239 RepID=UPI00374CE2FB